MQRVLAREGAEGHGAKNRAVRRKVEPVDKAAGKHSQTAVVMKLPALARRGRQHRQGCPQGCAGWRGWEEAEGEPRRPLPRWIGVLRAILQIRRTPPMSPMRTGYTSYLEANASPSPFIIKSISAFACRRPSAMFFVNPATSFASATASVPEVAVRIFCAAIVA